MRAFGVFIILLFIASAMVPTDRIKDPIVDVSWPNCGAKILPSATEGVVGLTGGLNFHPNSCLAKENRFTKVSVYTNTGYPGIDRARDYARWPKQCGLADEDCLAYNYGYNAATYTKELAFKSAIVPDRYWLDVEFGNTWSDDASINVKTLIGMWDAARNYVGPARVGFYSYPFQWAIITNNWKNGLPVWVASGSTKRSVAEENCQKPGFTGGPVLMAQYTEGFDQNIICR